MNLIFSAIVTFFSVIFVLIGNLASGNGFVSVLFRPILAGAFIFGLVTLVQFVMYQIFNVASFSMQVPTDSSLRESSQVDVPNDVDIGSIKAGVNVDFVVGDDSVSTESGDEEGNSSIADVDDDTSEQQINDITVDIPLVDDNSDLQMYSNTSTYNDSQDSYLSNSSSSIVGKSKDEIIQEKLGFDASVEDMAKAIRTTLKRDE